jgi:hypothetical protein
MVREPRTKAELFTSCIKRHKFTTKVCNKNLYAEVFIINPAGVNEDYLTDSVNFRMYVGKWDDEHENYSYICKGDSIEIEKFAENEEGLSWQTDSSNGSTYLKGDSMKMIETKTYNILDLKKSKIFE